LKVRVRRVRGVSLALLVLVGSSACGPVGYVGGVVREAGRAVVEAEQAGARRAAPYEWTAALLYLEEARTLAGYARWQEALAMGRRSAALARSATARARRSPAESR